MIGDNLWGDLLAIGDTLTTLFEIKPQLAQE